MSATNHLALGSRVIARKVARFPAFSTSSDFWGLLRAVPPNPCPNQNKMLYLHSLDIVHHQV